MNRSNKATICSAIILLMVALLSANVAAQGDSASNEKKILLVGRVLAGVTSLTTGAGIGPQYQTFIFGVESKNSDGTPVINPVEIVYAFHKDEGSLPDGFYDHSKLYQLNVERDSRCDRPLSKLAYQTNSDATGKELPPTNALYIPYGVPRDVFKTDSILPCYVLYGSEYKVIKQDADRITRCDVHVPRELQGTIFNVVYSFDTDNGRPIHITRLRNDALPEYGFTTCISRWTVQSISKGVVTFLWNPADGWTMNVSPQSTDARLSQHR